MCNDSAFVGVSGLMPEGEGRARPFIIAGLVGAFALMAVAIIVAVATSGASPSTGLEHASPSPVDMTTAEVTPSPSEPPTSQPTATLAPPPPPVARPLVLPEAIAARSELPFCGHETVNRQPDGDYYDRDAWACFRGAQEAGQAAEVIRDSLTVEAGSIREIFRLLPSGEIEWYMDTTQDPLSAGNWTRVICESLAQFGEDPRGVPIMLPDECGTGEIIVGLEPELEATGDEMAMLEELIAFARAPDTGSLDLVPLSADGVWLGLADQLVVRRTAAELADLGAWNLAAEGFRARVGPFSALDILADWNPHDAFEVREASVQVGEYPFCASAALSPPAEMADRRRLSIQPVFIGPGACLLYWTVDLFIGQDGSIDAITVDFGEP